MAPPALQEAFAGQMSPPTPPRTRQDVGPSSGRERREPSITPRRFRRFFEQSSNGSRKTRSAAARMPLLEILQPNADLRSETTADSQSGSFRRSLNFGEESAAAFPASLRMRKRSQRESLEEGRPRKKITVSMPDIPMLHDDDEVPGDYQSSLPSLPSSPCARGHPASIFDNPPSSPAAFSDLDEEGEEYAVKTDIVPPKVIVRYQSRGIGARILQRSLGRENGARFEYPANDFRDNTAAFHSRPEDLHMTASLAGNRRAIPFCAVGLHTNSLVAVGDDEGYIRLLDSGEDSITPFSRVVLGFKAHNNAVIDLAFSDDDTLLATGSGDQTAKVTDMKTQMTTYVLHEHSASLKQVLFQPGQNNSSILATSSRDGHVLIWDTRCRGSNGPVIDIDSVFGSKATNGGLSNSFWDAHDPTARPSQAARPQEKLQTDIAGRRGNISVTAIEFLPAGRENLLITASELDSCVKLWDIRSLKVKDSSANQSACTKPVQSHIKNRHYGITSLNMSSDGNRFFATCKDNTVYAYSTSHLMMGTGPSLDEISHERQSSATALQPGLQPIYGYRHPRLHVSSFYVKAAVRKPKNGKAELLAVGSGDGCAVLFPTDEKYLPNAKKSSFNNASENITSNVSTRAATRRRVVSEAEETMLISQNGTALIEGHMKEVSSVTFTSEGDLVTVDDAYLVRRWREGGGARQMRQAPRTSIPWNSGWADVDEKYDDEDEV